MGRRGMNISITGRGGGQGGGQGGGREGFQLKGGDEGKIFQ